MILKTYNKYMLFLWYIDIGLSTKASLKNSLSFMIVLFIIPPVYNLPSAVVLFLYT